MASTTRACLVALLAFVFLELESAAAGSAGHQQGLQVQSLLRQLNKAPVASIQSPDGDIIDCVHISKQPAFDHPLLKNHTIQMRPSYYPAGSLYNRSNIALHPITQTWHQNGKCPEKTVPIRRTRKEDVLRASSVERYGKKRPDASATKGHQYAQASAPVDKYYGTEMKINLWQPTIKSPGDFSLTQTWVTAGSYENKDLNTIEAGWQVFPGMYGDDNARLFIFWTSDAYETGCYNLCSGFVQTSNQVAIGGSLSPVSIYDGSQYEINILIWKDQNSGNWWLQVQGSDLGYWPSSIFTHLADSASSITWGGEVESPDSSTPMGSGHFSEEGFRKASYIRNIQVVGSSNNLELPNALNLLATEPNYYNVKSGASSNWGSYIFYGGPGKNPN